MSRVLGQAITAIGVCFVAGCGAGAATPSITQAIPWAGKGVWLRADTHTHTPFSDGANTIEQLAAKAEANGVDVLAITDHLDRDLKGATPEYFAALDAARQAHPRMVIITGAEWNIPPAGGGEHVVILVPPGAERELSEFKERFDDLDRDPHQASLALDGLQWLQSHAVRDGIQPVAIYEHPSRPDAHSMENVGDVTAWRRVNDIVAIMAGAPGHQGKAPTGSYKFKEQTIDRWDPVVARVGDAWDTLLGRGLNIWAAYAPSDFHNDDPADLADRLPGAFSETWLYAPDRTINGALRALRAGSFFADHGHIVEEVQLEVTATGARAATPGEILHVAPKTSLRATLRFKTPALGADGKPPHIDLVELIGIDSAGARVLVSQAPGEGPALAHSLAAPAGGIVLRARGFQSAGDGSRLAFYTNPVRIVTDQ